MKNLILIISAFLLVVLNFAQPCISGELVLDNQSQIDNFAINYPDCNEILGTLVISGNNISNLVGLESIESIQGALMIIDNLVLANLGGMNNLDLDGFLCIAGNQQLMDISALSNITDSIYLEIADNPNLENLNGLQNVELIYIEFGIYGNLELSDISALENVHVSSEFTSLIITDCPNLNICGMNFICEYLEEGILYLFDNNHPSCPNEEGVAGSCITGLYEFQESNITLWPNPTSDRFFIDGFDAAKISVFNNLGEKVVEAKYDEKGVDVHQLSSGIYVVNISDDDQKISLKLLIP